jgi:hypothetical protein
MFELRDESYIQLFTAVFLTLSAFTGGYGAAGVNFTPTYIDEVPAEVHTFDIFSYKALEVNELMTGALANPTEEKLRSVNNKLAVMSWSWVNRQEGDNKALFVEYLTACQVVIDEKQAGHDITDEKKEMTELYTKLRPE